MLPAPTFRIPGLEVKPSPGKGNGLFATQNIPSNTKLADYKGIVKHFKERNKYFYSMNRINKIIDGSDYVTENPSHYCNESRTPNVVLKKKALYTLRDIQAGEELFLRYCQSYPRDYVLE